MKSILLLLMGIVITVLGVMRIFSWCEEENTIINPIIKPPEVIIDSTTSNPYLNFKVMPESRSSKSIPVKNDTTDIWLPLWNLKEIAKRFYPCNPIHDTTIVRDTLYLPEPAPVFNQLPARTQYTASWHAVSDSTMSVFIMFDAGKFAMPAYMVKTIEYPESTCVVQSSELAWQENQEYLLSKILLIAQDHAGNQSGPSDTAKAVFARNPGTWGDVAGEAGKFDRDDYAVMQYFIARSQYQPAFDYNCDGKTDSLDFKIVRGE